MLKWLREREGADYTIGLCESHVAAAGGYLEVLKWLKEQGNTGDWRTCYRAAQGGYLDILKWLADDTNIEVCLCFFIML